MEHTIGLTNEQLKKFEEIFIYESDYRDFLIATYGDYTLYDITAKYGAAHVVSEWYKWDEKQKEISIGDFVGDADGREGVVVQISNNKIVYLTTDYEVYVQERAKLGRLKYRNVANKLEELFMDE